MPGSVIMRMLGLHAAGAQRAKLPHIQTRHISRLVRVHHCGWQLLRRRVQVACKSAPGHILKVMLHKRSGA